MKLEEEKMKRNFKRKIGLIFLIFCLVLGLYACEKSNASDYSQELVSYEDVKKEFAQTVKELTWPEGYEVPKEIDQEKDDSQYEKGFGNTRASLYWEIAWEREWLNTYKSDSERAKKALEELEKAKAMPYMSVEKCDDATRDAFSKSLEQANNGDPSGFEEHLKLNSPE